MIDYQADPKFWQRFLSCAGFYHDEIDGVFGSKSRQAAHDFEQESIAIANRLGSFDGRSESHIQTLLPAAQSKAREFMLAVKNLAATVKVISGTRTYAEQNTLYRQGRDAPGKRVTNARGGKSNHNFGVAWDIGLFQNGQYLSESPLYSRAGAIGKQIGLEWESWSLLNGSGALLSPNSNESERKRSPHSLAFWIIQTSASSESPAEL